MSLFSISFVLWPDGWCLDSDDQDIFDPVGCFFCDFGSLCDIRGFKTQDCLSVGGLASVTAGDFRVSCYLCGFWVLKSSILFGFCELLCPLVEQRVDKGLEISVTSGKAEGFCNFCGLGYRNE